MGGRPPAASKVPRERVSNLRPCAMSLIRTVAWRAPAAVRVRAPRSGRIGADRTVIWSAGTAGPTRLTGSGGITPLRRHGQASSAGLIPTAVPVDSNVSCADVVRLNHCPEGRRMRYDDSDYKNGP